MHEDTIYRCVNPACARLMPRPVKFCPWCGTAQATGRAPARDEGPAAAAAAASTAAVTAATARDAAEPAGTRTAAARESWSDAPPSAGGGGSAGPASAERDAARAAAAAAVAAGTAAARAGLAGAGADTRAGAQAGADAGARTDAQAGARARGAGLGTLFGHGARAPAAQPQESVPRPPIPPRPAAPRRSPIRLRWWVVAMLILWGVWLAARPNSGRKIEQRIDHAIALAQDCKAREAQNELIALRQTRATDAQLERLQTALNEGAAACTRKRQRDKAWQEASNSAESALAEQNPERARARLQAFTRRWGDDQHTRALRSRIDDASHPLAVPEG